MLNIRADVESQSIGETPVRILQSPRWCPSLKRKWKQPRKRTNVKTHADHHKIRSSVLEEEEKERRLPAREMSAKQKKRLQDALDTRIDSFTFDVRGTSGNEAERRAIESARVQEVNHIRLTNFPGITVADHGNVIQLEQHLRNVEDGHKIVAF